MSVQPTARAPNAAVGSKSRSGPPFGEAALWAGAAIVAIAAHAGVAWWILAEPRAELPPAPEPGAITFELAAMPVAPEIEPDVAPGPRMTQQDEAPQPEEPPQERQPPEPEPEPVPEPEPQPEPEPEPEPKPEPEPEPEPEPIEELPEADPPIEPDVEIPVPTPRPAYTPTPQPAEPRPEPPEPEPAAPEPPPQRQATPPPQRQAAPQTSAPAAQAPAPTAAAPVQSRPEARSGVSPQRWQGQLLAHLERRKRYPSGARSRGEQGTAQLTFSIDRAGNIVSARLSRSSGFAELDQAVIDMISRASPVPPPPQSVTQLTFTVPVEFSLR